MKVSEQLLRLRVWDCPAWQFLPSPSDSLSKAVREGVRRRKEPCVPLTCDAGKGLSVIGSLS